jgi:endoglucanase
MKRKLVLVLILAGLALAEPADVFSQLTPQQAFSMMGRGINMGNTLEPPQEGAWNNPAAQEYYFDDYKAAGFKTVRIPVRWDEHMSYTAPYPIVDAWMDRVEQVVDWALQRDLVVILNAHHEEWIKADYENPSYRARFDSLWSQVATRFADKSEKLLLEIINEPFGQTVAQTDDLNARVLGLIRRTNPTRIVVIGGSEWSNSKDLLIASFPDDDYLMAYYHSYDPWEFGGLSTRGWGSTADRAAMHAQFQLVANWSAANNIPVMLSEFGAIRTSDWNDRMKYYAAAVEEALEAGIATQVWDDGGNFRVYERETRGWRHEKDVLIGTYMDSPTGLTISVRDDSVAVVSWTNRYLQAAGISVQRATSAGEFETIAELSGTATSFEDGDVAGGQAFLYRVIARNGLGADKYSYPQRYIVPAFERSGFYGTPLSIPGTIQAEDFDVGGEGLTYHDTEPENIPGGYRPDDGPDIEARTEGGWQLAYVEAGEWVEYTIDVQTPGTYEVTTWIASLEGFGRMRLTIGGVRGPTIRAPSTGSWQTLEAVGSTMDLVAGEQVMRLDILTGGVIGGNQFNVDKIDFALLSSTASEPEDVPADDDLELYPLPAGQSLHLTGAKSGRAEIYDVLGRRVLEFEVSASHAEVDLSTLPAGLYLLRLDSGKSVESRPFVRR